MSINVLFVSDNHTSRGPIAQAILAKLGAGSFRAFSAAIDPVPPIDPFAQEILNSYGGPIPPTGRSSVVEFQSKEALKMDVVIALTDEADEIVRSWQGPVFKARWRILDPVVNRDSPAIGWKEMKRTFSELEARIRLLVLVRHRPRSDRKTGELTPVF